MSYFEDTNFYLKIAQGLVPGYSALNKFGRNSDVDTGAYEDIWTGGGTWVPPTAARVHDIVSTDTDDDGDPAGNGARTVVVIGLNGSYEVTTETVTMNGITNVATANSYVIIYRMYVATAGSSGANEGTITATAQTDSTVTARIEIGDNQTLMAIYQVPASKTGYLLHYYASMNNPVSATSADVKVLVKSFGGVYQVKHILGILSTGDSILHYDYDLPLALTEKSIIKLAGQTSGNNVDMTGGFDIVLVDN